MPSSNGAPSVDLRCLLCVHFAVHACAFMGACVLIKYTGPASLSQVHQNLTFSVSLCSDVSETEAQLARRDKMTGSPVGVHSSDSFGNVPSSLGSMPLMHYAY
jgi:hypothetical protein